MKAKAQVVLGQHAEGPDWEYTCHLYSDGTVIAISSGPMPLGISTLLETDHHGEGNFSADDQDYLGRLRAVASGREPMVQSEFVRIETETKP